jgi:hypothetical protein
MSIDRGQLDGFGRVYKGNDGMDYPSVTTIIHENWNDHEGEGLRRWKEKMDGKGDRPHHEDIREYAQHRGTLVHYTLLNPLTTEELWSEDEQSSLEALKDFGMYYYCKEEDPKPAFKRYQKDLQWAKKQFELVKEEKGIDQFSTIRVEEAIYHNEPRYAGQFDLLYEDNEGDIVLADIKTSKRTRKSNRLQLSAYSNALDIDIDEHEIIKLHPDYEWVDSGYKGYKPVEIDNSRDWGKSIEEYYEEFEERAWTGVTELEKRKQ